MYVLDDYKAGRIYAGYTQADLQRNLPNDFYLTTEILNSLEQECDFIWNNEAGQDYYIFKTSLKKLIKYMEERDCLNFIQGV